MGRGHGCLWSPTVAVAEDSHFSEREGDVTKWTNGLVRKAGRD